jgi:toxin-antitoxin system PIN domain toxin
VIAVDTNVLVYAHRAESPQHVRASDAIRTLAEGDELWALPIFALTEFLRVVTHPRLYVPPTPMSTALEAISHFLESPTVRVLRPDERFWPLLKDAIDEGQATGNLVFDAQIVAVSKEHGVTTILSADRDFRRFPSIKLHTL